eukprot:g8218.t1
MWRDGELEICGRKDAQVKLHGVRIELAEIESSLSTMCEGAAVVQALQDSQTLVAFVARMPILLDDTQGSAVLHLLEKEIAWMNLGPLACAVCIWASMLLPIAAFLILAAPILQTLLIAWPWQIASFALRAARVWWNLRMQTPKSQPLLNDQRGCNV